MGKIELMKQWYSRLDVQYQLIKHTWNREFAALPPSYYGQQEASVRYLRCHSTQHVRFLLFDMLKFQKRAIPYNFYYSLASYVNGLPRFTPNLKERDVSAWKTEYHKSMTSYDWLIDIDMQEHTEHELELAKLSALKVSEYLDRMNRPHHIRFTGKGFHIVVPHAYLPFVKHIKYSFNPEKDDSLYVSLHTLTKKLHDNFSEMVDYHLNDSRRIIKLPWSLSHYHDRSYVCLPMRNTEELKSFRLSDAQPGKFKDISTMKDWILWPKEEEELQTRTTSGWQRT